MIVELAAIGAAATSAACVVRRGGPAVVRRRLGTHPRRPLNAAGGPVRAPAIVVLAASIGGAFVIVGDRPHLVLLAITAGGTAHALLALRRRSRRRTIRHRNQAETIDMCDAIVAELGAGIPPARALSHVAADWPVLAPAARTADLGGDVTDALRTLAHLPGRAAFAQIGAAWEVSISSGAGLAGVLERLAAALRADDEARQEVTASLGAPRATARVLAVLPLLGLALGAGVGGDPLAVLLGSLLGAGCLIIGSALALAGLFWVEHIADAAELN